MKEQATILVIDDDVSLRRVMEFTLQEAGYRVLAAENGEQGMELFRSEHPLLVVTDIQMPGISGYDVLRQVLADRPDCPVIVVTAYGTVEQAVEAMKTGAFDYITKPFSRDELTIVVKRALGFHGLQAENLRLREQLEDRVDFSHLVGISDVMQSVFDVVRRVAASDATVLIGGESGTGKELVAKAIHNGSERSGSSFVPVNCAAIPADLLESELFGHVKGAFTGATRDRKGKFELADGGTLFLDEVGELSPELQPKLLRALQEREIEPVGGNTTRKVDVRVIAASNRDLEAATANGQFREDLYYRLSVIPLHLPPLRERRDDIPVLVRHFLDKLADTAQVVFEDDAIDCFCAYDWPGNVRELENVIEQVLILRRSDRLAKSDLPAKLQQGGVARGGVLNLPPEGFSLEELEKTAVLQALQQCGWNQSRAARFLRVPRHTLVYRMEKYGISKP